MNLLEFLNTRWPGERAWVTMGLAALIFGLLQMAADNPGLWDVELFKTLLTATVVTGVLNMVLAFHFAANKADEAKTANTGAAFRALEAQAKSGNTEPDVVLKPGETAQAQETGGPKADEPAGGA